jgi:hypothetical protein
MIDMGGNVQIYKAKLVVKSYKKKKKQKIDYDETFLLVDMFKSIRILLIIVVYHD